MNRYRVTARRAGQWWALEAPDVPGVFSQTTCLEWANDAACEALSLILDVDPEKLEVEIIPEISR